MCIRDRFRKSLDFAEAGDNIGALLRGVDRTQIERGQVRAKPGSVHPHKTFESQVYVLTKDEGAMCYKAHCCVIIGMRAKSLRQ